MRAATLHATAAAFALCAFLPSGPAYAGALLARCPEASGVQPMSKRFPFYSADGVLQRLEVRSEDAASDAADAGVDDGCDVFSLPVEAADILWVGPVADADASDPLRGVTLQGTFAAQTAGTVSVSEVEWAARAVGSADAPVQPDSGDRAPDAARRVVPAHDGAVAPVVSRSAWIWSPEAWNTAAGIAGVEDIVEREGLDAVYVTVPVADGTVSGAAALEAFVTAFTGRGVAVWAVAGDPHDVLPAARAALLARAEAYRAYNRTVAPEARLAGLQLDVEPYLLPGFALAPGAWRVRYLDMFDAVHAALDTELPLDMVVPVWWGTHPDWGTRFLRALARPRVSVTVMNYRTHPEALRAGARPFLDAGDRHGYPVRMAIETGPLPDETRRLYHPAPERAPASLWLVREPSPALVLLAQPRTGLPGTPYAFTTERAAPGANLTFGPERAPREAALRRLAAEWSAWKSFSGIALHGLDAVEP